MKIIDEIRNRYVRWIILLAGIVVLLGTFWNFYPVYCVNRAESALYSQDLEAAQDWIQSGLHWSPDSISLHLLDARWNRRLSRFEEMNSCLSKAAEAGADKERIVHEQILASAQTGTIGPLKNQLADLLMKGKDLSDICDAYVRGCLMVYRIDEAEKVLGLWKADLPDDPQPHFLAGRLLEHQVELDGAIASFEAALQRSQQHAPAAYNLGRIYFRNQKYEKALMMYEQARDSSWNPNPALVSMAQCAIELEQPERAARYLSEVTTTEPADDLEMYRYLGDPSSVALSRYYAVKGRLAQFNNDNNRARQAYEEALTANPQDWRSRYQYSQILRKLGLSEQAKAEVEKYRDTQSALKECDESIRRLSINPNDVEARMAVARVMMEHISESQGIIWLKSVLLYDPDHVEARQMLDHYDNKHSK
ncbi:tetratricopeptide repeat protein [Rubinisphaera italica]|uniref:Tetratricopeptide repeat protein n=1 Tax=Rubinisphaera italica TaxID=2527969 RepID=A0A5C5XEJ9_9PLAN|nr:tetratricopeptide repeat protein [Rubinisphaera italica]TWT60535.1 tetratricopeptide repeat protein [Rubinisphaera italica]